MVVDDSRQKVFAWYDNEWGYSCRMADLTCHVVGLGAGSASLQQYGIVTANYWAFTLTDGALRMLVVFHFHQLGCSTLEIAFLFLFYEFFGVVTNLYGGWMVRATAFVSPSGWALLQILSLVMLIPVAASWPKLLSVGT